MRCGYDNCCEIQREGQRFYCAKHECSKRAKIAQARLRAWIKQQSDADRNYLLWLAFKAY